MFVALHPEPVERADLSVLLHGRQGGGGADVVRVAVLRGVLPLQDVGDVQVSQGQAGGQRRPANAEAPHLFPHGDVASGVAAVADWVAWR